MTSQIGNHQSLMKPVLSLFQFIIGIVFLASTLIVSAGDIAVYGIVKEQRYVQTNNAAPSLESAEPFAFQCFVDATGPGLINGAFVSLPGGGMRTLTADGDEAVAFNHRFSMESALNSAYGQGTYTMTIDSESDFNVAQLFLPSGAFPNAPQITNFPAAQAINSSNEFTLGWLPFAGGTSTDFIELEIRDGSGNNVFRSGDLGTPEALNGTNTSIVIPAGTLFPGETYRLELLFARIALRDTTSIPNANGVVGFLSWTLVGIKTTGQAAQVALEVMGLAGGTFQFRFNTQPGKAYQVQFADTLPNWQNYFYTNATSSEVVLTDVVAGANAKRFFRVMVP